MVRIRHFGFLANRHRAEKIERARQILRANAEKEGDEDLSTELKSPATELRRCPHCKKGQLVYVETLTNAALMEVEGIDSS